MATDSLLAALHGNYGLGEPMADDVNTVRGLLSFCRKWTEGLVHPGELEEPCFAMAGRLRAGADEMEADLKKNPDMGAEMREPVTRTMEAYRAISEVLEEFADFAKEGELDDFLDNLEVFEEERQAVLESQELIRHQLSGKALLCPRCGEAGEGECPTCLLTRLYPDPQALRSRHEQARLSGLYGKVFRAYQRVTAGECSLHVLWEALDPLEDHLETLITTRKQLRKRLSGRKLSGHRLRDASIAERLLAQGENNVEAALKGIERMRSAEESLRMSDLSRGWEDIFFAAQEIEMTAARIRRHFGDDESEVSHQAAPSTSAEDLISFSGEEP